MKKFAICILCIGFFSLLNSCDAPSGNLDPEVRVDSTLIKFFQRTEGWIASDGATSVHLDDGRTLWLMGDSHIDDYDAATGTIPALFQVRNCALVQPHDDWDWHHTQTLIGNGPGIKSFFKNNPSDDYFMWPGSGFQIGDTVYCYLGSLKKTGDGGTWGWGPGGNDLFGKLLSSHLDKPVSYGELPDLKGINFGLGFVKDEDKQTIYAYGSKLGPFGEGIVYVALISMENPGQDWKFWDGSGWSPDIENIAAIDTVRTGVSVTKIKDKYVLISSDLSVACDQGRKIYSATSNNPTGPFTPLKEIYEITDTLDGHYPFFYSVMAHPQFINDKDELLITYCINGYDPCVETFKNGRGNPDHYRPKGIRVPLDVLDSEL